MLEMFVLQSDWRFFKYYIRITTRNSSWDKLYLIINIKSLDKHLIIKNMFSIMKRNECSWNDCCRKILFVSSFISQTSKTFCEMILASENFNLECLQRKKVTIFNISFFRWLLFVMSWNFMLTVSRRSGHIWDLVTFLMKILEDFRLW